MVSLSNFQKLLRHERMMLRCGFRRVVRARKIVGDAPVALSFKGPKVVGI